jgi:ABC-type Fe3+ transport system substrate-binding protein
MNSAIDAQIAASNMDCDLAMLQTLQDFERWKRANALLPYQPDGFDQIPAGFKDPDATNIGTPCASTR